MPPRDSCRFADGHPVVPLGTGLLGGYTTYSTLVLETIALGSDGRLLLALAYDAVSLVGGFLAALGAMAGTRALLARRPRS